MSDSVSVFLSAVDSNTAELCRVVEVCPDVWRWCKPAGDVLTIHVKAINTAFGVGEALVRDGIADRVCLDVTAGPPDKEGEPTMRVIVSEAYREEALTPAESIALATYSCPGVGGDISVEVPALPPDAVSVSPIAGDMSPTTGTVAVQVVVNNDPTKDIVDYTVATQLVSKHIEDNHWQFSILGTFDEERGCYVDADDNPIAVADEYLNAVTSVLEVVKEARDAQPSQTAESGN